MDTELGTRAGPGIPLLRAAIPGVGLLLLVLASASCFDLDVSQPIILVPRGSFSEEEDRVLDEVAESWNLELGSYLTVDASPAGEQQVPVFFSDFLCAYAFGVAVPSPDMAVQICSLLRQDSLLLRRTALHELGHVLGIASHAADPLAVMSTGGGGEMTFRPEDRSLFEEANPGFEGRQGCERVRLLATSLNRPILAQAPGQSPLVIWAEQGSLRFSALDLDSGRGTSPAGRIDTKGTAQWIRAASDKLGITVTWLDDRQYLMLATIPLPGGGASSPVTTGVDLKGILSIVSDVSMVLFSGQVYVAITVGSSRPSVLFYRIDPASGRKGTFSLPDWESCLGQLTVCGDELQAVALTIDRGQHPAFPGLWVHSATAEGRMLQSLQVEKKIVHGTLDYLHAAGSSGGLFILHASHDLGPTLYRVRVKGGLAVEKSAALSMPGSGRMDGPASLVLSPPGLIIAASSHADLDPMEVVVSLLDPVSLGIRSPWRRLSTPDATSSVAPGVGLVGNRAVVIWRDWIAKGSRDVKGRCFRF